MKAESILKEPKRLIVLSLFDGCAGARQALDNLRIPCTYYASEIDKFAIKVAKENYPDIIQLGDITKLNIDNLPRDIDLVIGGSPCQSLSNAARLKGSGLENGKSKLFWEYVRVLNLVKPRYFVLENVASMKKIDRDMISDILGVEPVLIDSAMVTAQHRKRLYWCNFEIPEIVPIDIELQSVLQNPDDFADRQKSYCLTATYQGACEKDYLVKGQRQMIYYYGRSDKGKLSRSEFKKNNGKDGGKRGKAFREWILRNDNKTAAITCNPDVRVGFGAGLRKLTPIECERLQGMKDNYTGSVSNTQRYKMIGNGFTIPVIEHILRGLICES